MTERPRLHHAVEPDLDVSEYRRVLVESGLSAIRPVDDAPRLKAMLAGADLIVTARLDQPGRPLVGLARCVTDWAWCCYLSELAVSPSAQGLGVGRGLLDEVRRQVGPQVALILSSVPEAAGFYERVGMARITDAFWFKRER